MRHKTKDKRTAAYRARRSSQRLREKNRTQAFEFLDLPADVREVVYEILLDRETFHKQVMNVEGRHDTPTISNDEYNKFHEGRESLKALSRTASAIHGEIAPLLWSNSIVNISARRPGRALLLRHGHMLQYIHIMTPGLNHNERPGGQHFLFDLLCSWPTTMRNNLKMLHISISKKFNEKKSPAPMVRRELSTAADEDDPEKWMDTTIDPVIMAVVGDLKSLSEDLFSCDQLDIYSWKRVRGHLPAWYFPGWHIDFEYSFVFRNSADTTDL